MEILFVYGIADAAECSFSSFWAIYTYTKSYIQSLDCLRNDSDLILAMFDGRGLLQVARKTIGEWREWVVDYLDLRWFFDSYFCINLLHWTHFYVIKRNIFDIHILQQSRKHDNKMNKKAVLQHRSCRTPREANANRKSSRIATQLYPFRFSPFPNPSQPRKQCSRRQTAWCHRKFRPIRSVQAVAFLRYFYRQLYIYRSLIVLSAISGQFL